jgi:hypothetical protein
MYRGEINRENSAGKRKKEAEIGKARLACPYHTEGIKLPNLSREGFSSERFREFEGSN